MSIKTQKTNRKPKFSGGTLSFIVAIPVVDEWHSNVETKVRCLVHYVRDSVSIQVIKHYVFVSGRWQPIKQSDIANSIDTKLVAHAIDSVFWDRIRHVTEARLENYVQEANLEA